MTPEVIAQIGKWKCDPSSPSGLVWAENYNRMKAGDIAGRKNKRTGYWEVSFDNKKLNCHRLVFMAHHGPIPEGMAVDHIDCDKSNNCISNLRLADPSENNFNTPKQKNNASGVKGVHFNASSKRWCAKIQVRGVTHRMSSPEKLRCVEWIESVRSSLHGDFSRYQ